MNERRQSPRYTPEQELEAYDMHTARYIGRFVDISEGGFLLFCPQLIDVESIWHLRILAAQDPRLRTLLSLGAECLWVRSASEANHCWAGFQIIDISSNDRIKLRTLFPNSE